MKIAIIGGGAAGLMATFSAHEANPQAEIFLLERNNGLGKKVIISGGGRCNVTTGLQDLKLVLTKYPRGAKFITSAMHQFPPRSVYEWFEAHGVPLKNQADNRVFPVSDNGRDVVAVFEKSFADSSIRVQLKTTVEAIKKNHDRFEISLRGQTEALIVDRVVLTTGGQAYRQTGSTGDGYAFAISLGHSITQLAPSLNSFTTIEKWPAKISGLSFANATVSANRLNHPQITGPILFTHRGLTGPAVFAFSSLVAFEKYDATEPLVVAVDVFPDCRRDALQTELEELMKQNAKKNVINALDILLPKSLSEILGELVGIDVSKNAGDLSKKEITRIVSWLKSVPLTVVNLHEVNPATMESKICPGLFFAGEILDVDGFTGGFNLQASWATGRLAGLSAAKL
jgi:predicted Rossmann fold flavoprotein